MEHRKTPARKALTLPGWIIVLSALVCVGAASYYVILVVDGSTTTASVKPTITPVATVPTAPAPAPTRQTSPPPSGKIPLAPVARDILVGVYNNTGTAGLARSAAAKAQSAGWTVSGVGNWRGVISETTVYYPTGFEQQAQTLARDLGVGRVRPLVSPMRSDRLSLILSGPQ